MWNITFHSAQCALYRCKYSGEFPQNSSIIYLVFFLACVIFLHTRHAPSSIFTDTWLHLP